MRVEDVIMAGMISGADIQAQITQLEPQKREIQSNQQICNLVTKYGLRLDCYFHINLNSNPSKIIFTKFLRNLVQRFFKIFWLNPINPLKILEKKTLFRVFFWVISKFAIYSGLELSVVWTKLSNAAIQRFTLVVAIEESTPLEKLFIWDLEIF